MKLIATSNEKTALLALSFVTALFFFGGITAEAGEVYEMEGLDSSGGITQTQSGSQGGITQTQNGSQGGITQTQNGVAQKQGGISGGCAQGRLCNPLKADSITGFLLAVIEVLLIFAVPIIVFFIIYAGFLFVVARGDTSKISTARSALTWAIVGGVIVLGAKIIIEVIQNTVASF